MSEGYKGGNCLRLMMLEYITPNTGYGLKKRQGISMCDISDLHALYAVHWQGCPQLPIGVVESGTPVSCWSVTGGGKKVIDRESCSGAELTVLQMVRLVIDRPW